MSQTDKLILSAYGSHNASIAMTYRGQYWVVEVERWLNSKNIGLCNYMPSRNMQLVYDEIVDYLLSQTDRTDVDIYITGYMNDKYIKPKFKFTKKIGCEHHMAHAACSFYQSPYQEALVISFDGGGDSKFFTLYKASRTQGIKAVASLDYDLGFPYMYIAHYLEDIRKEAMTIGNLVYAGKIMGLAAYGKVIQEWLPAFDEYYSCFKYAGSSYLGGMEASYDAITTLMKKIGVEDFKYDETRFTGEMAYNLATTSQYAFEEFFYKLAGQYLTEFKDLPLCLSGGCALNVLLNTRLAKERDGQVFVPPNTNDCGLAVGQILWYQAPGTQIDLTYSGLPMMDANQLSYYLEDRKYATVENVTLTDLATYLAQGFIVGFIQGNSEHGSRALGNRSIFCNPGIKDMKDTLNDKVKHREWYRPFAPLVKLEKVHEYFTFHGENSRHMTFVADVKDEWKDKLPAITHEDGTGRLQTVTKWENEAVYNLLTEFEKVAEHGCILNTSFNDNGKPILTRFTDALNLLTTTKLDAVYYHERRLLIFKYGEEKLFKQSLTEDGIPQLVAETTVSVLAFGKSEQDLTEHYLPIIEKLAKKVERMVVIIEDSYATFMMNKLDSYSNIRFFMVGKKYHYYDSLIQSKYKTLQADTQSTHFFSTIVRHMWVKDVMLENTFNTQFHLFIDLSMVDNYNYNVTRDIKHLIELSKLDTGEVGMTGVKPYPTIFDGEMLDQRWGEFKPTLYPYPYLFYGNTEAMIWLADRHEAMLHWELKRDKVGVDLDYMVLSYADRREKYTFIELEKGE